MYLSRWLLSNFIYGALQLYVLLILDQLITMGKPYCGRGRHIK